ncbi:MAG: hypothetical protein KGL74_07955 [Elusimicrobia bacterium]|nr:hypothetical protein [Elusimicrobiota bacterium]
MSMTRASRLFKTSVAAVLAFVLVALAPGLAPYEAAAQFMNGAAGLSHGPTGPAVVLPGSPIGGVSALPSVGAFAPALNSSLPAGAVFSAPAAIPSGAAFTAPGAAAVAPSAVALTPASAFPVLPASALLSASPSAPSAPASFGRSAAAVEHADLPSALRTSPADADGREAPVTVRGQLAETASALESARGAEKSNLLNDLFTGARRLFGLADSAPSASASPAPAPSAFAALTPAVMPLAAAASDEAKPAAAESRATPPAPVVKVGDGLNPGSKLLAGEPPADNSKIEGPQNDNWIDKKGMTGMFIQRSISIALFIQTALAYPLIAIHAVGVGTFGVLMALGPLAAIATGPLNGLIADRMSPRNGLIMLSLARAAQVIALPLLAHFALLNFWTLLAMSIANGWQLSLLMTSENAYLRRLAGKNHLGNLNALNAVNYLALQVFLTLILGIGSLIDKMGPMMPYYASAVILPLVVCPIIWFMVPNTMAGAAAAAQTKAAVTTFSDKMKSAVAGAKAFLGKYWKEIGLLGATLGAYLMWHTTLPMSGALFYWVSRTDGFKAVWSQKSLRATMLLSALAFGLIYPFQYMALPLMAGVLGGVAGKAAILGQMTGALFFGQLVSNASQANLPAVKIPFTNYKVPAQRIVQGLVLVLGAAWSLLRLFPGNWAAAAASVAIGSTLMFGASKFTDKGWVKFLGIGLAAASILPLVFWGSLPVMFGAMLALGMFVGPASVALNTYFGKNARSASIGNAFGVNSSLGNTATSFGYGLLTMLVGMFTPVFPHALMPIAVAFMIIGAIFFFLGPKFLPGMSDSLFKSKPAAPADKK